MDTPRTPRTLRVGDRIRVTRHNPSGRVGVITGVILEINRSGYVVPGLPPGAAPETVAEVAEEERARLAALSRPPEPQLNDVQCLFGR